MTKEELVGRISREYCNLTRPLCGDAVLACNWKEKPCAKALYAAESILRVITLEE